MAIILVVDDRRLVRETIETILERAGHDVALAANGLEALSKYEEHPADLIVLDMFMPEMNGFDALVEFRKRHGEVNVLAMSGGGEYVQEDALEEAVSLGAHRTIAKPFSPTELIQTVDEMLNS